MTGINRLLARAVVCKCKHERAVHDPVCVVCGCTSYAEQGTSSTVTKMEQQPQRQDSLNDQLRDLQAIANKLGMYDAADFIQKALERKP